MVHLIDILFFSEGIETKSDDLKIIYYENNNLKEIGLLKHGMKSGIWFKFRQNESLESIENYVDNNLNGIRNVFYPDGQLFITEFYIEGKRDGDFKEYHFGGSLHTITRFEKDVLKDGLQTYYFPNGNKKIVQNYLNGKFYGEYLTFYHSGNIKIKGQYNSKGLKEGIWYEYYENGNIKEKYSVRDGLWHGKYEVFDEKGKIIKSEIYNKDKKIG